MSFQCPFIMLSMGFRCATHILAISLLNQKHAQNLPHHIPPRIVRPHEPRNPRRYSTHSLRLADDSLTIRGPRLLFQLLRRHRLFRSSRIRRARFR